MVVRREHRTTMLRWGCRKGTARRGENIWDGLISEAEGRAVRVLGFGPNPLLIHPRRGGDLEEGAGEALREDGQHRPPRTGPTGGTWGRSLTPEGTGGLGGTLGII